MFLDPMDMSILVHVAPERDLVIIIYIVRAARRGLINKVSVSSIMNHINSFNRRDPPVYRKSLM